MRFIMVLTQYGLTEDVGSSIMFDLRNLGGRISAFGINAVVLNSWVEAPNHFAHAQ